MIFAEAKAKQDGDIQRYPQRNQVELTNGEAEPTRVQFHSNLAYGKLVRYLDELESKKMIVQNPLRISEKGYDFLQDYDRIRDFLSAMNIKYFDSLRSEIYEH